MTLAANPPKVEFINASLWIRRYQRNNKRSGLKNLRCFPFCADDHKVRGFCGRAAKVQVEAPHIQTRLSDFIFFGEFVKSDSVNKTLMVGKTLSEKQCVERERTKEKLFNPWFKGEVTLEPGVQNNPDIVQVEFNKRKKGWHYGWVANKHTCDSQHVLRVFVLEVIPDSGGNLYRIISTIDSPSFTIFCRRRQRDMVPNLPEQIKNQIRNVSAHVKKEENEIIKEENNNDKDLRAAAETLASIAERKRKHSGEDTNDKRKRRVRQKKAEKMIWRVIQALLQIDFKWDGLEDGLVACCDSCGLSKVKEDSALTTDSKMKARWSRHTNCQVCKKPLGNFSDNEAGSHLEEEGDFKTLSDFLDVFLPEISGEEFPLDSETMMGQNSPQGGSPWTESIGSLPEQDFMMLDGGTFNLDFQLEDIFKNDNQPLDKDKVLQDLGTFLIDENCLTKAIDQLLRSPTVQKKSFQDRKSMVLGVFAEQIQIFLNRFGIGLEQFDSMLKDTLALNRRKPLKRSNSFEVDPGVDFERPSYEMKVSNLPVEEKQMILHGFQSGMTGDWCFDDRMSTVHELIRQDLGIPWLVRKMMAKMERQHSTWFVSTDLESIEQNKVQMVVGCKGKLLSSGQYVYNLDGQEHSQNYRWPLPVQNAQQRVSTVPRTKAYMDYDKRELVIFHNYGETNRSVRKIKEKGGYITELAYEVRESPDKPWITRFFHRTRRVSQSKAGLQR